MKSDHCNLDQYSSDEEEVSGDPIFKLKPKSDVKSFRYSKENDDEELNLTDEDQSSEFSDEDSYARNSLDKTSGVLRSQEPGNIDSIDEQPKSSKVNKKLNKLSSKELQKQQSRMKRTGVCYLSRIPPYMKPSKLKSILSKFGKIDRLFLKPEDSAVYHKRVKYGGNKKKNFTEGWVEFVNKKDAKLCAATLNGNKIGGKKTSFYYDDIMNIKYLSGFKWMDLTQQIAQENDARQAKLAMELSQQNKLNKAFVNNVEKSKLISNIQKKRKLRKSGSEIDDSEDKIRRNFKQRKINSSRVEAPESQKGHSKPNEELSAILSNVF